MNIIRKVAAAIKKHKDFIITVHDNPDGDAIGSGLALAIALCQLNKNVSFYLTHPVAARYQFLPSLKKIVTNRWPHKKNTVLFLIDTANFNQINNYNIKNFNNCFIINIDHHIDNKKFGNLNWIDIKASAVGEQIYKLLRQLRVSITPEIATCLYTAIVTDSGYFQYSNTTTESHKITAALLAKGITPQIIAKKLSENSPLCKLRLLQLSLATIKTACNGKIIWMWLTNKMIIQAKAKREHSENFIDFLKGTTGVKVAIMFKEGTSANEQRVSFRSIDPKILVNRIAHQFQGGGHPAASGCTISGSRKKVEQIVLQAVKKAIRK